MFKTAAGGALALLGASALGRDAAALTGYDGDPCMTNGECREGLSCHGGSTGILGGSLAGGPYGPPGVTLPVLSGREGRCRYQNSCGGRDGDGCRRSSDCCDGFACNNNRCRSK
jgi:hypothetical protein